MPALASQAAAGTQKCPRRDILTGTPAQKRWGPAPRS